VTFILNAEVVENILMINIHVKLKQDAILPVVSYQIRLLS
jgi:hypothetical protein